MPNRVDVLDGRQGVGVFVVVDDAPAGQDGTQIEVAAQILAHVVEPPPEPQTAIIGVDEHIHAIERVAVGIVTNAIASRHQILVGVLTTEALIVAANAQRHAHHPAVVLDHDLPLGEIGDQ